VTDYDRGGRQVVFSNDSNDEVLMPKEIDLGAINKQQVEAHNGFYRKESRI
jgi:hypothetical protein